MFRCVDVRGTKVGHQQLPSAEYVQRQIAVPVVVAVEEATGLMTVHRVVGRVEVQHQFPGPVRERGDELLHQLLMNRDRPLALGALLEPAKRRRTRQRPVALARRLNHQVVAKNIVVVQILVPQRHRMHALTHHRLDLVTDLAALAPVTERTRHCRGQPQPSVNLAQQQRPAIGRNRTAGKIHPQPTPATP